MVDLHLYSEDINIPTLWTKGSSEPDNRSESNLLGIPLRDQFDSLSKALESVFAKQKPTLRCRVQPQPFALAECPPLKNVLEMFEKQWTLHEIILDKEFYLLAGSNLRVSKQFFEWIQVSKKDRKFERSSSYKSIKDCYREAHHIYSLILSLGHVLERSKSRENLWTYQTEDLIVWMDMVWRDTWYSYIKNTIVYLFNKYEDLEERVFPDILKMDFHLPGLLYFHNYLQQNRLVQLISGNKKRQISSRWTLLQGLKKGMPHCGSEAIWKDCQKHVKLLTEEPSEPPEDLKQALKSILHQVFPEKIGVDDWKPFIRQTISVSTSACYEAGRGEGGALSHLYPFRFFQEDYETLQERLSLDLLFPDLLGVAVTNKQVKFIYGPSFEFDINLGDIVNLTISEYLGLGVSPSWVQKPHWVNDFEYGLRDVSEAFRRCYVKLIQEPLKNRPITVQSRYTNAFLQPIQKLMWKALQNFKIFQLTGREVEEADIAWLNEQSTGKFFKSGDYQSATDGLNKYLTKICIHEIAKDEETRRLMEIALLEQTLDYSEAYDFDEREEQFFTSKHGPLPSEAKQKNGQLMGCVLSFPLLCIINAAVLGLVFVRNDLCKSFENGPDISTMKCLVNGDDILFKCNHDVHEDWQSEICNAGFKESPGKSYLSEKFAMINSTYFRVDGEGSVKRFGYINYSWITGVQKGKDVGEERIQDLTCLSKDFFDRKKTKRTTKLMREKALGLIHLFRSKEMKMLPLDISQEEGGLGLPIYDDSERNPFYQRFSTWLSRTGKSLKSTPNHGDSLLPSTMVPSKYLLINRKVDIKNTVRELVAEFKRTADFKGNRAWVPCSYDVLEKKRLDQQEKLHVTESFTSSFSNRCLGFECFNYLSKLLPLDEEALL